MTDVERLLERQAQWQRSRRTLSWPEKIRLAERIRPSVEAFRIVRERRRAADAPGEGQQRRL
jgi:hypothetical protein